MLFEGQTIKAKALDGKIAELRFERGGEAVNKLDALAFGELRCAIDAITATPAIKGVLITSAKDNFIVGADIFEFTNVFKRPEKDIAAFVGANSETITALSDLPVPTVAAINGLALGGGFEVALGADYRVMSSAAKIGFPEIHLGIFPGYGGTVRLPRLTGLEQAPTGSFLARSKAPSGRFERARPMPSPRRRNCARRPSQRSIWQSRGMPIGKAEGCA